MILPRCSAASGTSSASPYAPITSSAAIRCGADDDASHACQYGRAPTPNSSPSDSSASWRTSVSDDSSAASSAAWTSGVGRALRSAMTAAISDWYLPRRAAVQSTVVSSSGSGAGSARAMCNASSATREGRRASRSRNSTGGSNDSATSSARAPRLATAPVMRAARRTSFSATALSRSSASVPGVWRPTEATIMSQPLSRSPPGLASSARRRTPSPASASIRRPTARSYRPARQSSASRRSSAK